ncbi:hypothetical protein TI83_05890 [Rathayibacter toxicus]|nr:hypothetical protein TI83_05890 [Rathayibacter toxicus]
MLFLDTTIVGVSLAAIGRDLNTSVSELQWVVNSYLLALVFLLMSAGVFVDWLGARLAVLLGIILFSISSMLCAISVSVEWLIFARCIQGLAASIITPGCIGALVGIYPRKREQAVMIGVWSAVSGTALAIGPIVGAALVVAIDWRAVFWLNVPLGIWAIAHLFASSGEDRTKIPSPAQSTDSVLLGAGAGLMVVLLVQGTQWSLLEPRFLALMAACAAIVIALLIRFFKRRKSEEDVKPDHARLVAALLAGTCAMAALYSVIFAVSLLDQTIFGRDVLAVGLGFLPLTCGLFIASLVAGWLADRVEPLKIVAVGLVMLAIGLSLIALVASSPDSTLRGLALAVIGVGASGALTPGTIALVRLSGSGRAGSVSGLSNTLRNVGAAVGTAISGAMLGGRLDAPQLQGGRAALAVCATLSVFSAAVVIGVLVSNHRASHSLSKAP